MRAETEKKIRRFVELPDGWNYGEGIAPSQVVRDNAIRLNQIVLDWGFFATDAFPGTGGEVDLTVYHDEHCFEFIFDPDGRVTFCHEENEKEVEYTEGLSLSEATDKIRRLAPVMLVSCEELG